jgi:murein L,D-transpeptidase YafK
MKKIVNRLLPILEVKRQLFIILLVLFFSLSGSFSLIANAEVNQCSLDEDHYIVIYTQAGQLFLCEAGKVHARYSVAIGCGGTGKNKQGDKKTPLGTFSLGKPRASDKFYIFIPINYPTSEQQAEGFTGGDIGIHGPWQPLSWLGRLTTWVDWTQGCIALGRNEDIQDIANWVKKVHPKIIIIQ